MEAVVLDHYNDRLNVNEIARFEYSKQSSLQEGDSETRGLFRGSKRTATFLEKLISNSRILIIEGISGSGKDTFQKYLKVQLANRDVYDYSEGELLQSWKQAQIDGILRLRLTFVRSFLNYMKTVISHNENAVFLLNRFHLSTYASTVAREPELKEEYDELINVLKTLPVHVFVMRLDENEIQERSEHPERSAAWRTHQKEIVQKEGFRDTLDRHIWQQTLAIKLAKKQALPYTVIKLICASETLSIRKGSRANASGAKLNVSTT